MREMDDYQITQANALVYGASSMTLREKRLFYLAVCKVAMTDNKFLSYSVPVEQLKGYLGLKSDSMRSSLEQVCDLLLSRVVRIHSEKGWIAHQYVSRCRYTKAKYSSDGQATLEIRLHEEVKPFLLQLRNRFQSIKFQHLSHMTSIYAMRIFEILWHKRHVDKEILKNKIVIEVPELRRMLGLEKKYTNFGDFKRYVLAQAQKEIKKNTPLAFTYDEICRGRKIISITFTVFENDDYKAEKLPALTAQMMLELNETEIPKDRKKIINGHLFKHFNQDSWDKEIEKFKKKGRTIEQIEKSAKWAVTEIDKKSRTNNPVIDPCAYVRWAVREGKL